MSFLKKNHVPWMTKGRWYKVFIESTGSAAKITYSDIEEATITNSTHLNLPHDFNVVETLFDVHNVEFDSGSASVGHTQTFTSNGSTYLTIPAAKSFDYMTVYIFGVRR